MINVPQIMLSLRSQKMKRGVIIGLTALALVLLAAAIVKATSPEGCKTGFTTAMTDNDYGCQKTDPNSQ
jgi:hypothetical protein